MAVIRLEVEPLIPTLKNDSICRQAQQFLNIKLERMSEIQFYLISGAEHKKPELQELIGKTGHEVFCDPITSRYQLRSYDLGQHQDPQFVVEVSYKPGVTDNTGHSASEGLKLLEISAEVASGKLYFLHGNLNLGEAQTVAFELLGNELIENVFVYSYKEFFHVDRFSECIFPKVVLKAKLEPETITLNVTNAELEQISLDRCLALTLDEMNVIKNYFENEEVIKKRTTQNLPIWPTDVELEVLAQTWSEHCKHKIFAAKINYSEENIKGYKRLGQQNIGGLYKDLIKNSTKRIEKEQGKDWLISVFSDNAGIVRFDNSIDLCIKVETHNSPSALDPYGGALTGILGVNRDILGCGLGARPIANMDVFCFAPPALAEQIGRDNLPVGPKEPRRILEGVHLGVEDGGNKSGIPTVNGAFFFEENFAGKPLVFVGTVGALPQKLPDGRNTSSKNANSKDRIFMIGGAIGADGIHGATFSSLELNENSPATAVQIGDPLTQKRTSDFLLEARDLGLYSSVTDNGAGGLSSSVGEMATMTGGAEIDLSLCPMKYPGLTPYELMISESQERMTVAVPPLKGEEFLALAKARGVSASDIGEFNQGGYLSIYYGKNLVADLELDFLHDGLPSMNLCAKWDGPRIKESWLKDGLIENKGGKTTIKEGLNSLLSRPNIVSKESWVRRYDHEVQAATHIKPFGGETASGPNDSGVIWLYPHGGEKDAAAVIGCGLNPFLSQYDPYLMAQFSVDEAIRNIVATGGDIDNCCLLDNFCWPDPVKTAKNPDGDYKLGQLVRTCYGLYDICLSYGTPLVSGKDSMKNDFRGKNKNGEDLAISILPTLLVTAMAKGKMGKTCTSDFKNSGDAIYVLGEKSTGLLGSEWSKNNTIPDEYSHLPSIEIEKNKDLYRKIYGAHQKRILQSVHDVSDGGILCALAESTFGNRLGANLEQSLEDNNKALDFLFNEGPGRFIVSISPENVDHFEKHFEGHDLIRFGKVSSSFELDINNGQLKFNGEDLFKAFTVSI